MVRYLALCPLSLSALPCLHLWAHHSPGVPPDDSALQSALRDSALVQVYHHYRAHIEATNVKMDI
jgi:hypothetical protein